MATEEHKKMANEEVVRFGIEVRPGDMGRIVEAILALELPEFRVLHPYKEPERGRTPTNRIFNPNRVTILEDPPGLALITARHLIEFSEETEDMHRGGLARRFLRGVGLPRNNLQEFGHFVGEVEDEDTIVGIKAEGAETLLAKLQANRPAYKNLGERSIQLFNLYRKDLYLPND